MTNLTLINLLISHEMSGEPAKKLNEDFLANVFTNERGISVTLDHRNGETTGFNRDELRVDIGIGVIPGTDDVVETVQVSGPYRNKYPSPVLEVYRDRTYENSDEYVLAIPDFMELKQQSNGNQVDGKTLYTLHERSISNPTVDEVVSPPEKSADLGLQVQDTRQRLIDEFAAFINSPNVSIHTF